MDGQARAAAAAVVAGQVNRAAGLLREAARGLAVLAADAQDIVGMQRVHDAQTVERVDELMRLGMALHGSVDVVVIASPARRGRSRNPTTAPDRAKENST
jgi:hypothetical protein